MNPAKRRTVIAGNWKMNFTPAQAREFIAGVKPLVAGKDNCDIIFCAPYVTIAAAMEAAEGSNIKIGAENVHFAPKGAYTGEVSAEMLSAIGAGKKVLVVLPAVDAMVQGSLNNIEGVKVSHVGMLNVVDILRYQSFVVTADAVKKLENMYDDSVVEEVNE